MQNRQQKTKRRNNKERQQQGERLAQRPGSRQRRAGFGVPSPSQAPQARSSATLVPASNGARAGVQQSAQATVPVCAADVAPRQRAGDEQLMGAQSASSGGRNTRPSEDSLSKAGHLSRLQAIGRTRSCNRAVQRSMRLGQTVSIDNSAIRLGNLHRIHLRARSLG